METNDQHERVSRDCAIVPPHPHPAPNNGHTSDGNLYSDDPLVVHSPMPPAILPHLDCGLSDLPEETDLRLQDKSPDIPAQAT